MRTLEEVVAQLATWDDVEGSLAEQGIQGQRMSSCSCPVAKFVQRETGLPISVGPYKILRIDHATGPSTPMNIRDFIAAFDGGQYPLLDIDYDPATEDASSWR